MGDSYNSPVFQVKNFSANNNSLSFKYTMPSSSVKMRSRSGGGLGVSLAYSRNLSVVPYTSSYDLALPTTKSSVSRHYTTPLPSLSISTAAESLLQSNPIKASMISPGSARSVRYTRSSTSSALLNGKESSIVEVQRNSYAVLAGSVPPEEPKSPPSKERSGSSLSPQRQFTMYPSIMSKSLLRYRHHSFARTPIISNRRCGSVDPEIYRKISVNRQLLNYPVSSSTTAMLERTSASHSRSESASNSRSGSIDRYANGDSRRHSGSQKSYSRESSYSGVDSEPNRKTNGYSHYTNGSNGTTRHYVTELARNVASHQWDSESTSKYPDASHVNGNGSTDHADLVNGHKESFRSNQFSRQSSIAASDLESCASTTSDATHVPAMRQSVNGNGYVTPTGNGVISYAPPPPPPPPLLTSTLPTPPILAVAQSLTSRRITTKSGIVTTSTTDIIDMKFVNGFVLSGNTDTNPTTTSTLSLDRISSPSKSTRQRIRLAKLQNKYGVFKSWLTPEDEQTLARAEARLAARRQARAEAREIRMKELEKQQKEYDDNADRHYDMYSTGSSGGDVVNRAAFRVALGSHRGPSHSVGSASYHSSRRSSEDSSEDGMVSIRDMRHELKELEDKFRKSMVQNAQLDNEKSALTYQVELLKDKIEDLEESLTLLQREYKDKCRDFENLKRLSTQLKDELEYCKAQLLEKEELIKEYGLVVVENEVEVDLGNGEKETRIKRSLVTQETAQVLTSLGSGSLDVRLKKFLEDKNDLLDQIRRLTIELEEERNKHSKGDRGGAPHNASNSSAYTNGPDEDSIDAHNASKQLADYRFKTQKYEQEIATLQANVSRLDGQVTRFKTAAEEAEAREDDLKIEKRKLQRELREAQSKLDELETTNSHLQKRLDKLKTAKSTLLKEL